MIAKKLQHQMDIDGRRLSLRWIGITFQIIGCILLAANVSWSGFAFAPMLAGSIILMVIYTFVGDWPATALNATFVAINILGIVRWLA